MPMTDAEPDVLLTAEEAMSFLGIGRTKFYDLRRTGEIVPANENPALDRQRDPLFSKNALKAFIKLRRAKRAAQSPQ